MVHLTRGRRFEVRLLSGPGEKPKTLVEMEVGELLSLSPDGKWISYYTEDFVKTRPFSTRWEVKLADLIKE